MKNFTRISFVLILSLFVLSCEKEAKENQKVVAEYHDFGSFSLAVKENTLVFEDEQAINACFEYLNNLGDDNFDMFEKSINYISYRSYFDNLPSNKRLFEDELYATLLNPEGEVIVGGYLLQDCPLEDQIMVYETGCDKATNIPVLSVKRSQDVFAALRGEAPLKSGDYCDPNKKSGTITDFNVDIEIVSEYNRGIFKYLKSKISRPWCTGCGLTLTVSNRDGDDSWCLVDEDGDNISETRRCDIYDYDSTTGTSASIRFNPGFKPTGYDWNVDFTVYYEGTGTSKTYNGDISCSSSTGCY